MDAISYLRQEHKKIKKTFSTISKISSEKIKKVKFNALCKELVRHETMEQKIWYPALRKYSDLKNIIKHLIHEEKNAAAAIKKFKKVTFALIWQLRFYKFKHDVLHHAKEEEQALFPNVRQYLDKKTLNSLGIKMRKFKNKLKIPAI